VRDSLPALERDVAACRRCPRLVAWLAHVRQHPRAAFRGEPYACAPVPGFGPGSARLLIVGLAPGAHGANRTGRPFTGDGAGPFLYGALARAGFANGVEPRARDDGLRLIDARVTNAARCAPPGNRPSPAELRRCGEFLAREFALCRALQVVLALGGVAWEAVLAALARNGAELPRPRPRFGHGARADLGRPWPLVLGAYHPSQLNTRTGRLTASMFDEVLARAKAHLDR
jgi:uracil-DNA glycosylase family 4